MISTRHMTGDACPVHLIIYDCCWLSHFLRFTMRVRGLVLGSVAIFLFDIARGDQRGEFERKLSKNAGDLLECKGGAEKVFYAVGKFNASG